MHNGSSFDEVRLEVEIKGVTRLLGEFFASLAKFLNPQFLASSNRYIKDNAKGGGHYFNTSKKSERWNFFKIFDLLLVWNIYHTGTSDENFFFSFQLSFSLKSTEINARFSLLKWSWMGIRLKINRLLTQIHKFYEIKFHRNCPIQLCF